MYCAVRCRHWLFFEFFVAFDSPEDLRVDAQNTGDPDRFVRNFVRRDLLERVVYESLMFFSVIFSSAFVSEKPFTFSLQHGAAMPL